MTKRATYSAALRDRHLKEIAALRERLREAQETLHALTRGEVDAIVRSGPSGEQVFTLKGAERTYRLMVETMTEGAVTLATDGVILYCNQRFADLVKEGLEHVIGARLQEFVAPREMRKFDALMAQAQADSAKDRIDLLRSDGTLISTYLAMSGLRTEETQSIVAVVTDLSELKRAETMRDQLARIVEGAHDGIIGKDLNGVITSWNQGAEEIYGYTAAEIVGRNIDVLAVPEPRLAVPELIAQVRRGEEIVQYETQHIGKGGQRIDVALTLSRITDANGALTGVSTFVRNITEKKKLEDQRAADALRLAELSRRVVAVQEEERKRLAAELHDRTSPSLSAVALNLGMIATDMESSATAEIDSRLADARVLLADAIANIRDTCADLRPATLDYAGLVRALQGYAAVFSSRSGIAVEVFCSDPDRRLAADTESSLFRIAQEALTNAAKHAKATAIKIELVYVGEQSRLTISDNGVGFDPKALGRSEHSPGLGLLTMRERTEFAGGMFILDSQPGQGTRIHVAI